MEQDTPPVEKTGETPQPEAPLTKEQVEQLIAERVAEKERHFQSLADKQVAEAQRKARDAQRRAEVLEADTGRYRGKLTELDPEVARELELAEYRTERQQRLAEEQAQQQTQAFQTSYRKDMNEVLAQMGIDPEDKGLDWAETERDFLAGQKKLLASAIKLAQQKQGQETAKVRQDLQAEMLQLRKDLGLDTQKEIPPGGAGSDDAFLVQYSEGKSDDHKRAKTLMDKMTKGG